MHPAMGVGGAAALDVNQGGAQRLGLAARAAIADGELAIREFDPADRRQVRNLGPSALAGSRPSPDRLELEITEAVLIRDDDEALAILGQSRELGLRIALDDFGTGYSSLAYLKRFPVDVVKIDRSFVKDLPHDDSSAAITAAIIAMAHALQKQVVAEGVSEADQIGFLRSLRCDLIQGFQLSRPLPGAELESFIASRDHARDTPEACVA